MPKSKCGPGARGDVARVPATPVVAERLERRVLASTTVTDTGGPSNLVAAGDTLYFVGGSSAYRSLWRTDGTAEGTRLVHDIADPSAPAFSREPPVAVGDRLVFARGGRFAVGEGHLLRPVGSLTNVGDRLLSLGHAALALTAQNGSTQLDRTDGTDAGTFVLTTFPRGTIFDQAVVSNGTAFFLVKEPLADGTQRLDLWKSDGTPQGTARLAELGVIDHIRLRVQSLAATDGGVSFFRFTDASGVSTIHRWASDGTAAGTGPVETIDLPSYLTPAKLVHAGGHTFITNSYGGLAIDGAWVRDTKAGGPYPQFAEEFAVGGDGTLYFSATDHVHGRELWASDGTPAGTRLLADVNPGGSESHSYPSEMTEVNGVLYFVASGGVPHKQKLWRLVDGVAEAVPFADAFFQIPSFDANPAGKSEVTFTLRTETEYEVPDPPFTAFYPPTIDVAELVENLDAIRLTGPDGAPRALSVVSVQRSDSPYIPDAVTFSLASGDAPFGPDDSGTYTLELLHGRLHTTAGAPVSGRVIRRLEMDIPASGPDLVASVSPRLPAVIQFARRYPIAVVVENRGDREASGPFKLALGGEEVDAGGVVQSDGSAGLLEVKRFRLAPGQRKTFRVPTTVWWWQEPGATYRLRAHVDAEGQIDETNETNNLAEPTPFVFAGDLRAGVSLPAPPPATLTRGATLRLPVRIENPGNLPLRGGLVVGASLDDATPDTPSPGLAVARLKVNLKPGASKSLTLQLSVPPDLAPRRYVLRLGVHPVYPLEARSGELETEVDVI